MLLARIAFYKASGNNLSRLASNERTSFGRTVCAVVIFHKRAKFVAFGNSSTNTSSFPIFAWRFRRLAFAVLALLAGLGASSRQDPHAAGASVERVRIGATVGGLGRAFGARLCRFGAFAVAVRFILTFCHFGAIAIGGQSNRSRAAASKQSEHGQQNQGVFSSFHGTPPERERLITQGYHSLNLCQA